MAVCFLTDTLSSLKPFLAGHQTQAGTPCGARRAERARWTKLQRRSVYRQRGSIACVATLNGHFACALLLLNGTERASLPLVAAALGVRRKALRMCRHDECAGLLGFAPGAVPAVGLRAMPPSVQLTVLMSEAVASTKQTVFVGGGSVEFRGTRLN